MTVMPLTSVTWSWSGNVMEENSNRKLWKEGCQSLCLLRIPVTLISGIHGIPHADCMNGNQLAKNVRILKHISSREDRLICGLNSLQPRMRWKGCYIPELVPWPKPSGTRKKRKNGKGSDNVSASSVLLWKNWISVTSKTRIGITQVLFRKANKGPVLYVLPVSIPIWRESSIICLNMRLTVIYRLSLQPPIP